jgi:hypothetical protein
MSDTLGSLRAEILKWMRGDLATPEDAPLVNAAINDSLENIWMAMMRVQLSRFFGSDAPVSFTLAAGQERVALVSIPDPTAGTVPAGSVAGGALPARIYDLSYTYVTESGSETNLAPIIAVNIGLNQLAQVSPPNKGGAGAFGWNLYFRVTNSGQPLALVNQQPLSWAQTLYTEPADGWKKYPESQQTAPLTNTTADNISHIRHMELRTSDTVLRAWNQYDISSDAMRRMAGTFPAASEFQRHAWDLINGRILEFRPAPGVTVTPRYFYVAKPRRLRYDPAEIPYSEIAGVHEYLVNKSISRLKLSIDEYLSATAFGAEADKTQRSIELALRQEDWGKNRRIQRFL